MSFDLYGQENATAVLKSHLRRGETRHAYLFHGAPGTGRRTMALRLAMILNCQNPPAPDACCGECRMCRLIAKTEHPDLSVVSTDTPGEILKIDAIRDLQRTLTLTPYEANWRIAIILRFEETNPAAQNALLKTLEEPPERVKLFLTASAPNAVLPTILSRCEPVRLRPMRIDALIGALGTERDESGNAPDPSLIERAAHLSGGRVGFAKQLIGDPDRLETYESGALDFLGLFALNTREKFAFAAGFRETRRRGELRALFQLWETVLRDLMISAAGASETDVPPAFIGLKERVHAETTGKTPGFYRARLESLNQAVANLNANVSPQLTLENFLINL